MGLNIRYSRFLSLASTNSKLRDMVNACPGLEAGTVVYTPDQTAGRGQRGNSWEAAAGKNVTMSMLLRPSDVKANEQFVVSEIVALAVARVVKKLITGHEDSDKVAVKWPNDIYVGNKKICGILIENSLMGSHIDYSIAGIGLNVNQIEFFSDAPNPVSIIHFTGTSTDVESVMANVAEEIAVMSEMPHQIIHEEYIGNLWRRNGWHRYTTPEGEEFDAEFHSVAPDGMLTLRLGNHCLRTFAFKEVSAKL